MAPAPPFDLFFMGGFPTVNLTWEELKSFHETDRALYSFLTINLMRDPLESMSVMALWLWLEQSGFKNIIKNIASKPQLAINQLADEAIAYINFLLKLNLFNPPTGPIDLPLTQNVLNNSMFLFQNQSTALVGIGKVANEVCFRILSDLLEHANEMNAALTYAETQLILTSFLESAFYNLNINGVGRIDPEFIQPRGRIDPGFIQPPGRINPGFIQPHGRINPRFIQPPGRIDPGFIQPHGRIDPRFIQPPGRIDPGFIQLPGYVDRDKRTMFVTFSKGYPVPERDIREFFYFGFGNCIESLHMDEVRHNQQSLFARIVFYRPETIDVVLNGAQKAKFAIKGRHIWMRRFVPKDKEAESSQRTFGSGSGSGSGSRY